MSKHYWSQKAATAVLETITEGLKYAPSTEPVTQEATREWCKSMRQAISALQTIETMLPTLADLDAEAREDDEKIGRSISTVEIPQ